MDEEFQPASLCALVQLQSASTEQPHERLARLSKRQKVPKGAALPEDTISCLYRVTERNVLIFFTSRLNVKTT